MNENSTAVNQIDGLVKETADIRGDDYSISLRNGEKYKIPEFLMDDDLNMIRIFGLALLHNRQVLGSFTGLVGEIVDSVIDEDNSTIAGKLINDLQFRKQGLNILIDSLPHLMIQAPKTFKEILVLAVKPPVPRQSEDKKPYTDEYIYRLESEWANQNIDLEVALDFLGPFLRKRCSSQRYKKLWEFFKTIIGMETEEEETQEIKTI